MTGSTSSWQPQRFAYFVRGLDTSMGTAEIMTDAGSAYIKAMGNRQGPHPLACEWMATHLARWFGLPTFDVALLRIDASRDEIPYVRGGRAASGPAFVTRKVSGHPWGGTAAELAELVNPEAVSGLVVFDTWTLNCDRYPPDVTVRRPNPDNVFLSSEGTPEGKFRLMAMDHTHCFTCGRDLTPRLAEIDRVKDERLYGLFPEFVPRLQREAIEACRDKLRQIQEQAVEALVRTVPAEWEVPNPTKEAWVDLICRRAAFVADELIGRLLERCPEPHP